MDRRLAKRYGSKWYSAQQGLLDDACRRRVSIAKDRLVRERQRFDPPDMVASLPFGFWVSLLGRGGRVSDRRRSADYERTLWRPALRRAFPNCKSLTRKDAHRPLDYLRTLRNRIAHHEAIFPRDLVSDYSRILEVTAWVSKAARIWVERHSRVPDLLGTGRAGPHRF